MKIIFEKGDKARLKSDWWAWKKGEIVEVEKWYPKETVLHDDWYYVKQQNGIKKGDGFIIDYMLEKA